MLELQNTWVLFLSTMGTQVSWIKQAFLSQENGLISESKQTGQAEDCAQQQVAWHHCQVRA
jgi:hypothetical protein